MRRGKAKKEKEKAPLGVTLDKVATLSPHRCRWPGWCWDDADLEDGDVALVRIDPWTGRSLAAVETTFSQRDYVTAAWLSEIASLLRGHRLRAPLVVGLVALRGRPPSESYWNRKGHPQHRGNPIRCIALCVGGSHALLYQPECRYLNHTGGLLPFRDDNRMKRLREFLGDKRVVVACVGAAKVAKKLAEEWGLHVARPRELTDLFAHAYGKGAGVEPEVLPGKPTKPPEWSYSWMSVEGAKRARAHAEVEQQLYEEKSKPGRWIPKVIEVLSMEYMAREALGKDMRLAPWPAKLADLDWGRLDQLENEHCMYATRDAYLCFDIAAHCLPKIGEPVA
ncbi:uncharacterized protein [Lolium perenne]|jgi:hypothetical protein|uniref:uncharacterized protein n=1 Tax=Lolium perenne TaxID=4522 RepID=UPI0021EAA1FA|nr:uncharacterized protein LOC127342676 [Lolium perenne]